MIGYLWARVRKQPIIELYYDSENELKFYNLEASWTSKQLLYCFPWRISNEVWQIDLLLLLNKPHRCCKIALGVIHKKVHGVAKLLLLPAQTSTVSLSYYPSKHIYVGHYQPTSETPLEWRFTGAPTVA